MQSYLHAVLPKAGYKLCPYLQRTGPGSLASGADPNAMVRPRVEDKHLMWLSHVLKWRAM